MNYLVHFTDLQEHFKRRLLNEQNGLILKAKQLQNRLRINLKIEKDENHNEIWMSTYNFIDAEAKTHSIVTALNTNTNTYKREQYNFEILHTIFICHFDLLYVSLFFQ